MAKKPWTKPVVKEIVILKKEKNAKSKSGNTRWTISC